MRISINDSAYTNYADRSGRTISIKDANSGLYNTWSPSRKRIHDANFAFLQNALSKLDPTLYKPKLFITYGEDMDIVEGGGLVDYVHYFTADWSGIADELNNLFGNQANYIPRINAGMDQKSIKVYTFELAYDLRFIDMEKANKLSLPQSIEAMYKDAVLAGFDLFANRIAYLGVGGKGGLFTSENVQVNSLTLSPTTVESATDADLLALLNGILATYMTPETFNLDVLPDQMLVPTFFGKALSERTSELYAKSLRNYFLTNNLAIDEAEAHGLKNFKLTIKTRPQLDSLGVNDTGRIVVYKKNPDFVKLHIPYAVQQYYTGPNVDKMAYTTLFVGQVSEIQLPYNTDDSAFGAVNYFDFAA